MNMSYVEMWVLVSTVVILSVMVIVLAIVVRVQHTRTIAYLTYCSPKRREDYLDE